MFTADDNRVEQWASIVLDQGRSWRERQKAAEHIGVLAKNYRRAGDLEKLLDKLEKFPRFQDNLLAIATDPTLEEPLRRASAWTMSQLNNWPDYFNEKVLDDKKLESHTTTDASLAFLPELGYAKPLSAAEQLEAARRFLPHLDGKGFELRWDTINHYVGLFFRVLQHPNDDTRRCIEFIYIWSRQVWPISGFFTYYFWPLLGIIALIPNVAGFLGWSEIVLLCLVLVFLGLYRTLYPQETRCFKNDSYYAIGGILLLLDSLQPALWAFLLPIFIAFGLFVVRRFILGETEHVMDYGPVFIYLKKKQGEWKISRSRIDKFHYDTTELGSNNLLPCVSGKTLFLETDNIWRSFKFTKVHREHGRGSYYGLIALWATLNAGIAVVVLLKNLLPGIFYPAESQLGSLWLVAFTFVAAMAIIELNEIVRTPISDPGLRSVVSRRFVEQMERHVLDENKLVHLWNMVDEKANLVIRKKLQNPFRTAGDKSYWKSFRDPAAEALAYEALSRLQYLEQRSLTNAK
jgi:hypothetical protein